MPAVMARPGSAVGASALSISSSHPATCTWIEVIQGQRLRHVANGGVRRLVVAQPGPRGWSRVTPCSARLGTEPARSGSECCPRRWLGMMRSPVAPVTSDTTCIEARTFEICVSALCSGSWTWVNARVRPTAVLDGARTDVNDAQWLATPAREGWTAPRAAVRTSRAVVASHCASLTSVLRHRERLLASTPR